jgi:hypothetical protein
MKKTILVAGSLLVMTLAMQAQKKKDPPPPPKPPQPPVELLSDVPPPPPPPPPPPVPPPPPPPNEGVKDDYAAFLKRNPSVKSLGWTLKNEVIVQLKSGREERYKLDAEGRKEVEAKYGELPSPPPPPPVPPTPPKAPHAPKPED